jgi:hypothetical protein
MDNQPLRNTPNVRIGLRLIMNRRVANYIKVIVHLQEQVAGQVNCPFAPAPMLLGGGVIGGQALIPGGGGMNAGAGNAGAGTWTSTLPAASDSSCSNVSRWYGGWWPASCSW